MREYKTVADMMRRINLRKRALLPKPSQRTFLLDVDKANLKIHVLKLIKLNNMKGLKPNKMRKLGFCRDWAKMIREYIGPEDGATPLTCGERWRPNRVWKTWNLRVYRCGDVYGKLFLDLTTPLLKDGASKKKLKNKHKLFIYLAREIYKEKVFENMEALDAYIQKVQDENQLAEASRNKSREGVARAYKAR